MPRNRYTPGMFEQLSPAEQLVELGAPDDFTEEEVTADLDVNGEALRPWHPAPEEPINGAPKVTVEDDLDLEFGLGYPRTAGGSAPFRKLPSGRWEKE